MRVSVCMTVCINECMCVLMRISLSTYVCLHVFVYLCLHMYVCICACKPVYARAVRVRVHVKAGVRGSGSGARQPSAVQVGARAASPRCLGARVRRAPTTCFLARSFLLLLCLGYWARRDFCFAFAITFFVCFIFPLCHFRFYLCLVL